MSQQHQQQEEDNDNSVNSQDLQQAIELDDDDIDMCGESQNQSQSQQKDLEQIKQSQVEQQHQEQQQQQQQQQNSQKEDDQSNGNVSDDDQVGRVKRVRTAIVEDENNDSQQQDQQSQKNEDQENQQEEQNEDQDDAGDAEDDNEPEVIKGYVPVKKSKAQKQQVVEQVNNSDKIIDMFPQNTFISNCMFDADANSKTKILSWNMVGVVSLRSEEQYTSIDTEFMNKNFHRNLSINDDFGMQMGCLNYSGMLLASKAVVQDMDDYEDDDEVLEQDELTRRKKNSNIQFKPFNEWKKTKEWNFELPKDESVECLALGSNWCAAYTDVGYIRVLSTDGIQKHIICQGPPLVTMAGYENLLAIVYHVGAPIYGAQSTRIKMLCMSSKDYKLLFDIECPISRYSNLQWLGFSEEGQLISFDTEGVLRALNFNNEQWTPILDFKLRYSDIFQRIWIVGVLENEVLAIEMLPGHDVPGINQRSQIRKFKLKVPLMDLALKNVDSKELSQPQIQESLIRHQMQLEHESFRKENWESLKNFRSKYDNSFSLSANIYENSDFQQKKKEMDKLILNAIRMSIIADENEKVLSYMDMLHFSQSLKLCVRLCQELKSAELAQKVSKYLKDKETKEMFLETMKEQKRTNLQQNQFNGSSAPTNIQEKKLIPQLEQDAASFANKGKNDAKISSSSNPLAQFAVTEPVAQAKPIIHNSAVNPFSKKTNAPKNNQPSDNVFADLSKSSNLQKRPNPFSGSTQQPVKQRKLFS